MEGRLGELLDAAPGPAPWYWSSFPSFDSGHRTWSWRREPVDDELRGWPALQSDWDGAIRFVPGWYTYAADAGAGHLLVWRVTRSGSVRLRLHRVDALAPVDFARPDPPGRDLIATPPADAVDIPRLRAGDHEGFALGTTLALDEILLLVSSSPSADDRPALAVYVWHPSTGRVTVLPQTWFTGATHDLGYDWVTRVARDPATGRIVGDGIRIPPFELEDDGTALRRIFGG